MAQLTLPPQLTPILHGLQLRCVFIILYQYRDQVYTRQYIANIHLQQMCAKHFGEIMPLCQMCSEKFGAKAHSCHCLCDKCVLENLVQRQICAKHVDESFPVGVVPTTL